VKSVIFDMDGVLIDSEPLWRDAERECFGAVGLRLSDDDMRGTMGFRVDEAVAHWYARFPWPDADLAEMAVRIVDRVGELVAAQGAPLPGVVESVAACEAAGLPLAVASSSPRRLIGAVLARLGVADRFAVVCSAEDEPYGKPHPGIFLTTAAALGVDPRSCLVIEDSVNGLVAAKAARMGCVVVPERPELVDDPRFALADHVLASLEAFPALLGAQLGH
jgi:sugar-phosphatase